MSILEASPTACMSPTLAPQTPQTPSQRSVSDVPSLDSACSSADSTLSFSTPEFDSGNISRRPRGFLRPQATSFAESARNRESVLNLGSIAHIQHYFARTGLLDGKGAQSARKSPKEIHQTSPSIYSNVALRRSNDAPLNSQDILNAGGQFAKTLIGSQLDDSFLKGSSEDHYHDVLAVDPTTSTYRQAPIYVPPPPTVAALRRELCDALEDAKGVLTELSGADHGPSSAEICGTETSAGIDVSNPTQGWYEIEGLHVLDLVTLAIRAAREFYTCHDSPNRLYEIKSERQIRLDLYRVLDVLKRVASRNFAGGYKKDEVTTINDWILGVETILAEEEAAQQKERERREKWSWLGGNWHGRERDREWLFLQSFDQKSGTDSLPQWIEPKENFSELPLLLTKLRDGTRLITLHNAIVQSSTRRFGEISSFHHDTEKPYRRSENLKMWIKAAELRWEVKLDVDVGKLVASENYEAWKGFDLALLKWCKTLREEITVECSGLDAM